MTGIRALLGSLMLFASFLASAATVIVRDGDVFDYDPSDTYVFDLVITNADLVVSFGANLEADEAFGLEVAVPPEHFLFGGITTERDFGGTSIEGYLMAPGTTVTLSMRGDRFASSMPHWVSIFCPESCPGTPGFSGLELFSSVVPASVPAPAAGWLMLGALGALLGRRGWCRSKTGS